MLALLSALAAPAGAIDVYGPYAILRWEESSGPVTSYAVYVDRNGSGFSDVPQQMTPAPVAFLQGEPGETNRVRVAAFSSELRELSDFSSVSSTFRFVPYQPPESDPTLLRNGSFEKRGPWQPKVTLWSGQTLPGWTVVGNSIDWVGSYWAAADGSHSLDLNGQWAGGVKQDIETEPGRYYFVYYSLAANPECRPWVKSFRISAAGEEVHFDIPSAGRSRWRLGWVRPDPFVFQADSELTTLTLRSTRDSGNGACGPVLDDVAVRAAF